jgi:drug/metabolite transporter (DMT)-like permease
VPETAGDRRGYLYIIVAVFFFATSAIFIIWAAPLSAFEITVGRLVSASVLVWLLAKLNHQPLWPRRVDGFRFVLFGLITALHFACYIASLKFTTVAHTLAITYTAPIFVTLFSAWFLLEPVTPRKWLGVLVAVGGIAVLELGGQALNLAPQMWLGDLLALGAAVTFALYSIAGRSQRERYGLFTYAGTVYILAALWALPLALMNFTPAGYNPRALLAVLAAGLLPLGVGHTLYNAALRRLHATTVNLIATQEVTGGVILGALLLSQVPPPNEIAGVLIALAGIVMVLI